MKYCPKCGNEFEDNARYCRYDGVLLISKDAFGPSLFIDPYIGKTIAEQFQIVEPIGSGSMGTVYKAIQLGIDREVAIKILKKEFLGDEQTVHRFLREAKVISRLEHPNIVHIYMFGRFEDTFFIAMEYLKGIRLSELLKDNTKLPLEVSLHIINQLLYALAEAHNKNVVHRDIKPENIILVKLSSDPYFVKLLDFGIAKLTDAKTFVTLQKGLIFGTAKYISPEAASGEEVDPRSDLYSVGVLAYQLLSGKLPFEANTPIEYLLKHINELPKPLEEIAPYLPERLSKVVMKSLEKRKELRPQSAIEFLELLKEAMASPSKETILNSQDQTRLPDLIPQKEDSFPSHLTNNEKEKEDNSFVDELVLEIERERRRKNFIFALIVLGFIMIGIVGIYIFMASSKKEHTLTLYNQPKTETKLHFDKVGEKRAEVKTETNLGSPKKVTEDTLNSISNSPLDNENSFTRTKGNEKIDKFKTIAVSQGNKGKKKRDNGTSKEKEKIESFYEPSIHIPEQEKEEEDVVGVKPPFYFEPTPQTVPEEEYPLPNDDLEKSKTDASPEWL